MNMSKGFLVSVFTLEVEMLIFWAVKFLENVLAFSLEQDLVHSDQPLVGEYLLFCAFSIDSKSFVADEQKPISLA